MFTTTRIVLSNLCLLTVRGSLLSMVSSLDRPEGRKPLQTTWRPALLAVKVSTCHPQSLNFEHSRSGLRPGHYPVDRDFPTKRRYEAECQNRLLCSHWLPTLSLLLCLTQEVPSGWLTRTLTFFDAGWAVIRDDDGCGDDGFICRFSALLSLCKPDSPKECARDARQAAI